MEKRNNNLFKNKNFYIFLIIVGAVCVAVITGIINKPSLSPVASSLKILSPVVGVSTNLEGNGPWYFMAKLEGIEFILEIELTGDEACPLRASVYDITTGRRLSVAYICLPGNKLYTPSFNIGENLIELSPISNLRDGVISFDIHGSLNGGHSWPVTMNPLF